MLKCCSRTILFFFGQSTPVFGVDEGQNESEPREKYEIKGGNGINCSNM